MKTPVTLKILNAPSRSPPAAACAQHMPTPTSDPARQTLLGAPEAFASLACVANRLRRGIGHVQIEATGDSITRGPTKRRMSYPAQLNQLLHSEFPWPTSL